MSHGKIKLIYFNVRGRAEAARLVLAQAGVEYEDFRFEREDWPELKKTMPTGQVPALEYNGQIIGQSMAITRFLAREFNLAGKDNWEGAKCDMVVDCINDIRDKFRPIMMEQDAAKKEELVKSLETDSFVPFVKNMEVILVKNGGKHFVGNGLTWADIYAAYILDYAGTFVGSSWKADAPHVDQLVKATMALPNIKKWVETRPVTER